MPALPPQRRQSFWTPPPRCRTRPRPSRTSEWRVDPAGPAQRDGLLLSLKPSLERLLGPAAASRFSASCLDRAALASALRSNELCMLCKDGSPGLICSPSTTVLNACAAWPDCTWRRARVLSASSCGDGEACLPTGLSAGRFETEGSGRGQSSAALLRSCVEGDGKVLDARRCAGGLDSGVRAWLPGPVPVPVPSDHCRHRRRFGR